MTPGSPVVLLACAAIASSVGASSLTAATQAPSFSRPIPLRTGNGPASVAIADVNGDRKPDILAANRAGKSFSVLVNQGHARFRPHEDRASSKPLTGLVTADVDRDGRRDVLAAAPASPAGDADMTGGSVSVFLNSARGGFQLEHLYPARTNGTVATGDLNGDGFVDFATGASDSPFTAGSSSIFLGDGDGTFTRAATCPIGSASVIADIDNDLEADVISEEPGALTVAYSDGDWKNCTGIVNHYPSRGGKFLALRDLDGDGERDIVLANGRATVSVLLNNGRGHFFSFVEYETGVGPQALTTGDLNGDHRPDLVTANYDAGTVSILLNVGGGRFAPKRDLRTGGKHPSSVAVADLTGDGRPDLAVPNEDGDTVSVFLNTTRR